REGYLDLAALARLGADELVLEAGNQPARAELDRHVFALAALERLAPDFAFEIHNHEVAGFCGALLRRLVPMLALAGELLDLLADRSFISIDCQTLELQAL